MPRILITGGASGIGQATTRLFYHQDWDVGLLDVNEIALAELARELDGCWYRRLDVRDPAACERACKAFVQAHGGIDVLFNCAGILQMGHFEDIDAATHQRILDINVGGLMHMTRAALPGLKDSDRPTVINMSSASALYGVPHLASYSASKFAVRGLTEALNIEWQRHGIRVLDIMAPFVKTPMVDNAAFRAPVVDRMGVKLTAEDIAEKVLQAATETVPVHNPVGLSFRLTTLVEKLAPRRLTRFALDWLSRE